MQRTTSARRRSSSQPGFTLIELMIAVAIVAIISALAYPSFMDSFRKGRRSEAFAAINAVQLAQERWRANNATYSSQLTAAADAVPPGLAQRATTPSGYYQVELTGAGASGYTVVATANDGTSQAADTRCRKLGAQVTGGNIKRGSGQSSIDWSATNPDSGNCWAR